MQQRHVSIFLVFVLLHSLQGVAQGSTTVSKLLTVERNGKQHLSKIVARNILANWKKSEINRTRKIGFWWHEKHPTRFGPVSSGGGVEKAFIHAYSNPVSRPSGPWPLEVSVPRHSSSKHLIIKDFSRAGFLVEQNDGSDEGPGDKALAFVDGDELIDSQIQSSYERSEEVPDLSDPSSSYQVQVKGFLQEDFKIYMNPDRSMEVGTLRDLNVAFVRTDHGDAYGQLSFDFKSSKERSSQIRMRIRFFNKKGIEIVSKDFGIKLHEDRRYVEKMEDLHFSGSNVFEEISEGKIAYYYSN